MTICKPTDNRGESLSHMMNKKDPLIEKKNTCLGINSIYCTKISKKKVRLFFILTGYRLPAPKLMLLGLQHSTLLLSLLHPRWNQWKTSTTEVAIPLPSILLILPCWVLIWRGETMYLATVDGWEWQDTPLREAWEMV